MLQKFLKNDTFTRADKGDVENYIYKSEQCKGDNIENEQTVVCWTLV